MMSHQFLIVFKTNTAAELCLHFNIQNNRSDPNLRQECIHVAARPYVVAESPAKVKPETEAATFIGLKKPTQLQGAISDPHHPNTPQNTPHPTSLQSNQSGSSHHSVPVYVSKPHPPLAGGQNATLLQQEQIGVSSASGAVSRSAVQPTSISSKYSQEHLSGMQ